MRYTVQGGKLFFIEHVLARGGARRYVQRICRRPFFAVFDGCDVCRETQLHIRAAGFQHVDVEEFDAVELTQSFVTMPFALLVLPHISGTATK